MDQRLVAALAHPGRFRVGLEMDSRLVAVLESQTPVGLLITTLVSCRSIVHRHFPLVGLGELNLFTLGRNPEAEVEVEAEAAAAVTHQFSQVGVPPHHRRSMYFLPAIFALLGGFSRRV